MRKIMLVVDDFSELVALEGFFRRLGFDTLSLGKDVLVSDALLRFTPDLVIATAKGRAVDGLKLAARMKRLTPAPRTALLFAEGDSNFKKDEVPGVDAVIEAPFRPKVMIQLVSQLLSLEPESLWQKYQKISAAKLGKEETLVVVGEDKSNDNVSVLNAGNEGRGEKRVVRHSTSPLEWDPAATPGLAATARSVRSDRYDKFLKLNDEPVDKVLPHEEALKAMRKLKRDSASEKESLAALDAAKREFAKALFSDSRAALESATPPAAGAAIKKVSG